MDYYSGIGSRKTPEDMCHNLTLIAASLNIRGYRLRSGGAEGADKAFGVGANDPIVFRPKHATAAAIEVAKAFHPAWHMCNDYVRSLHGRNAQIILGEKLDEPSKFVLCWTPNENSGGTSLGIRIARHYKVPVYNFAVEERLEDFMSDYLGS